MKFIYEKPRINKTLNFLYNYFGTDYEFSIIYTDGFNNYVEIWDQIEAVRKGWV